jgi:hypothetical protein
MGKEREAAEVELSPTGVDGRRVVVTLDNRKGKGYARVRYMGEGAGRRPFKLEYEDGQVREVTWAKVKELVMTTPAAVVVAVAEGRDLPSRWKLDSVEGVEAALRELCEGEWSRTLTQRMVKAMPGQVGYFQADGKPEVLPVGPQEVFVLGRVVDLSLVSCAVDPWTVTQVVTSVLRAGRVMVYTNNPDVASWADGHEDPMQPEYHQELVRNRGVYGIITAPPVRVLDLFLMVAVKFCPGLVAAYVPGAFVTDAPEPRQRWLQGLQQQGRLCLVMGLPKGSGGLKGVWVLVFASARLRSQMVRGGGYPDSVFTLG